MPTPPLSDGGDAAALAEGADLSDPDGVNRFRQQLIADVDELLREHHSRIAQHVEENMEDLYMRIRTVVPMLSRHHEWAKNKMRHSRGGCQSDTARVSAVSGNSQGKGTVYDEELTKISVHESPLQHGKLPGDRGFSNSFDAVPALASALVENGEIAEGSTQTGRPDVSRTTTANAKAKCVRSYSEDMIQKWKSAKRHSMMLTTTPETEGEGSETASIGLRSNSSSGSEPKMRRTAGTHARAIGARARLLVHSNIFESVTCMLIVTNSIFFGVETQFMAMGIKEPAFAYIGVLYTAAFTCELLLRVIADGKSFFWNVHWLWNVVDTFVVCMSLVELTFQVTDATNNMNLTYVRIIRIARTVRIFRVVRVLQAFSSLRILLYCVLNTLRSLIWTMVLLLSILYIFGILFTQAAAEVLAMDRGQWTDPTDLRNYDALRRYFGGLQLAIFTQFKAVTGGVTWQEVSGPLAFVHPFWEFLFTVFISFTYFAVLNVVTGVFCQSAIESAANDKDMVVQAQLSNKRLYTEQLRDLFKCIDAHHCGKVNFDMLESCLDDPQCQAYFEVLGITSDDAWNLFKLLDDDDSNQIELEEFVSGCLRLRGSARSIDSHMLLYESRWTMRKVTSLLEAFNELIVHLTAVGDLDDRDLSVQSLVTGGSAPTFDGFEKHKEENHHHHAHQRLSHQQEASSRESTTDSHGPQRHEDANSKWKSGEQRSGKLSQGVVHERD